MGKEQFPIWLNSKHQHLFNKFKQEIIEIEGGYYGYLGDYIADAMEFYLHYMKHFPEKIGKEKHTISNLTKSQKRMNKFIEFAEESLTPIKTNGLDYLVFNRLITACFQKSEKTIRVYEKEILLNARWSIIKIPNINKRIVLHRDSNLYGLVKRFDLTLGNYYPGLKPNENEKQIISQLKKKLLPKKEDVEIIEKAKQEADEFFGGLEE